MPTEHILVSDSTAQFPTKTPCLTCSDILHQLDSFPTYCEAKTQLVLLHHHTPVDESRAWKKRGAHCEEKA